MFKFLKNLFRRKKVTVIVDDDVKIVIGNGCKLTNVTVGKIRVSTDDKGKVKTT